MDQWIVVAAIVIIGLMLVSLLKTIIGNLIRYLLFVGMAVAMFKWANPEVEGFEFVRDIEVLQDLAVIGGIGFLATVAIMTLFFRKSRFAILLYPVIGFAATFAAWSTWPQIEAMWG